MSYFIAIFLLRLALVFTLVLLAMKVARAQSYKELINQLTLLV